MASGVTIPSFVVHNSRRLNHTLVKPSEPAVETVGLSKVYGRNAVPAVNHLDLDVPFGSIFGLIGPNGAGKTTTIGMLLGLVRPSSGSGKVLGRPLGDRSARRQIGYLPERLRLPEYLTATEFLDFYGRLYGISVKDRQARSQRLLGQVGLAKVAHRQIRTFSLGMQQRLGIAQALLPEPDLLVLDEPTSALDPGGRQMVRDLLLELRECGITALYNSHILSEVLEVCDRFAILRNGTLVTQGTLDEIIQRGEQVLIRFRLMEPTYIAICERFGPTNPNLQRSELTVTLEAETDIPLVVSALVAHNAALQAVIPLRERPEDALMRLLNPHH
ncbi:MAG: ABC transporter ATP-binding protein [Capsulimonadales bacterium]|nr:ABC transporter ATP-binding protein [Capsulimonadales bacterium]